LVGPAPQLRHPSERRRILRVPHIQFLIIGAQKAGSSSLFEYMRRHPEIHMPAEKGLNFFNTERMYERGFQWYETRMLHGAAEQCACGEATVEYINGTPFGDLAANARSDPPAVGDTQELAETVPRRIRAALPQVRLLCVLRDPVARAHSHYRMELLERVESRSFDRAVQELLTPEALRRERVAPRRTGDYVVNGEYHRGLSAYLRVFDRAQLEVIFSEELAADAPATLARVFAFTGVRADFVPENLDIRYREAAVRQRIPGLNLNIWQARAAGIAPVRAAWHALPARGRALAERSYSALNYRMAMWNAQRGVPETAISPGARAQLIEHYRPEGEALSEMLGITVPWLESWRVSSGEPAHAAG
jgi:hypothetical protein